jgi:hypothetical protein
VRERILFFIAALCIVAPPFLVQVIGIHSPHLRAWRMFSSAGFDAYRLEARASDDGRWRSVSTDELFEDGSSACFDEPQIIEWCSARPGSALYLYLQCGQPADHWRLVYDGKQDLCSPLL